ITTGQFTAILSSMPVDVVEIDWSQQMPKARWVDLQFASRKIPAPLAVGLYNMVGRYPFEPQGSPGLNIDADGRACNNITGKFQIYTLVVNNGALSSFTAVFEQHCEQRAPALRGCIHFEQ